MSHEECYLFIHFFMGWEKEGEVEGSGERERGLMAELWWDERR